MRGEEGVGELRKMIEERMVTAGNMGAKSGEGFYKYTPGSKDLIVSEQFACR